MINLRSRLEKLEDGNPESEETKSPKAAETQHSLIQFPCPVGPQIEALYELKKSRLEGWDKGIAVAALFRYLEERNT